MIDHQYCIDNKVGTEKFLSFKELLNLTFREFETVVFYQQITDPEEYKKLYEYFTEKGYVPYNLKYRFIEILQSVNKTDDFLEWIFSKFHFNEIPFSSLKISETIFNKYFSLIIRSKTVSSETILELSDSTIDKIIKSDNFRLVRTICNIRQFSKDYVLKNIDDMNIFSLISNKKLDFKVEELFNKKKLALLKDEARHLANAEASGWSYVSRNKLTMVFISKYKNHLSWSDLIKHNDFTESFLNKHKDSIDDSTWKIMGIHLKLSLPFIKDNFSKLGRFSLSLYSKEELASIKEMKDLYGDLF